MTNDTITYEGNNPDDVKPDVIKTLLLSKETALKTLLPQHMDSKKFLRTVFNQIHNNPDLAKCTAESIISSVSLASEFGLVPDGRRGALVPMKNGKKGGILEAKFLPMIDGLIELARNSGEIADIFPATVCENDEFGYQLGLHHDLYHRPNLKDRGKPYAYYAVVSFKDGTKTFGPGPMTTAEINAIRSRSKAKDFGPWVTDFEAMAWKTVLKRTLKYCPRSSELQRAIELDNENDFGRKEIDITPTTDDTVSADTLNESMKASKAS